ncbi:TRAPP complex subunit bet5 [Coemansia sp. BCRC 34301]|nr:TRAPP complex subunit bet5 [Coemansia sp. BCRC 34301]
MVVVYSIYIFDRHCECIFYTEWNRSRSPLSTTAISKDPANPAHVVDSTSTHLSGDSLQQQQRPLVWPTTASSTAHRISPADSSRNIAMEEEAKLVYGVAFSTRNIVNKLNSKDGGGAPQQGGNLGGFMSFATNTYRLHYYESPTGVKFILTTDVAAVSMQPVLEMIYRNIYVEYVVKNPLFNVDPHISSPIENDYFRAVLNNYIREISSTTTTA